MNIKIILSILIITSINKSLIAQSNIIVNINNFKNDNGVCRACLFNNSNSFQNKSGALACKSAKVVNGASIITFNADAEGDYAVMVFHDENNNNFFDKNFLGIPKEGYGASKNKLPLAAAPSFKSNSFVINSNQQVTLRIVLRYLF